MTDHKHKRYAWRHGQLVDITGQKPTVTELPLSVFGDPDGMPYRHVEGEDWHDELAYYIWLLMANFTVMSNLNKSRFGMVVAQLAREFLGDTWYRYARVDKPKDEGV